MTQWAAVSTCLFPISEPPQLHVTSLPLPLVYPIKANHGYSPRHASSPPTIRVQTLKIGHFAANAIRFSWFPNLSVLFVITSTTSIVSVLAVVFVSVELEVWITIMYIAVWVFRNLVVALYNHRKGYIIYR